MSNISWKPLEANPEVIAEYTESLGGPSNVQFSDVLSVEEWAMEMVPKPVLALLLVYPITSKSTEFQDRFENEHMNEDTDFREKIWFTKQTVGNACGTVALLHIFANLSDAYPLEPTGALKKFYKSTATESATERAKSLETDGRICEAHHVAENKGQSRATDEAVNEHFVAFLNIEEKIVELDGRKSGPLVHKQTKQDMFLLDACNIVKKNYMDADPDQIKFSLIAVSRQE